MVLERHLLAHGCRLIREGVGHEMWENPVTRERSVVPHHGEVKAPTARGICRQLSIPTASGR
ncbi:MAG: type II toxin-antitoxin system HicA family toxin [Solirubrobacteraceae bacterium]